MTLRELLTDLQAKDAKLQNAPVLVSHSDVYGGISHIDVMAGNIVIHLLDAPKLTDRGRELLEILTRQ